MEGKVLNTISGDEFVTYLKESLHNPDGIAGGKVDQITDMRDSKLTRLLVLNVKNAGKILLKIRYNKATEYRQTPLKIFQMMR